MAASAPGKKWATEPDWDKHRPTITRLYSHENRTLQQLIEIMDRQYNFHATPKMYKSRFKRWGLAKYNKSTASHGTASAAATAAKVKKEEEEGGGEDTTLGANATGAEVQLVDRAKEGNKNDKNEVVVATSAHRTEVCARRRPRVRANAVANYARKTSIQQSQNRNQDQCFMTGTRLSQLCRYHLWVSSGGMGRPSYLRGPEQLQQAEDMLRAIRDYYDGSFLAGRWTTVQPTYYRHHSPENGSCGGDIRGAGTMAIVVRDSVEASRKQLLDLHSRFRIAINILLDHQQQLHQHHQQELRGNNLKGHGSGSGGGSTATVIAPAAEGIKMLRICFAQLPEVLRSEDPALLNYMVDLVRRLRDGGLFFLETQLLQHLHGLASAGTSAPPGRGGGEGGEGTGTEAEGRTTPSAAPASTWLLWRVLRSGVALDRERAALCAEVVADQFARYLGPMHMQTIELLEWWIVNREATVEGRERGMRALYSQLSAELDEPTTAVSIASTDDGVSVSGSPSSAATATPVPMPAPAYAFDRRHLDVLMNLANLLRRNEQIAEAAEVLSAVLDVPQRELVLRQHPPTAFNFYWLMGKVRSREGRHREAEWHLRDALAIARAIEDARAAEDAHSIESAGGSEYLSILVALEQCLRDQGRDAEADLISAGRQDVIRRTLEEVGEKEDAV